MDFSGQEYDRYGFVKKYDFESGEFDPVTLEAQKLERKSSEVSDKVKAREKRFCFLFFFYYFLYIYTRISTEKATMFSCQNVLNLYYRYKIMRGKFHTTLK